MTTVRLAWGGPPDALAKALGPTDVTTVRLAAGSRPATMPQALADTTNTPALLVSFFYLKQFSKERHRYHFRNWSMDSGAYSAANSGTHIDRKQYHETCAHLLVNDPQLVEVFALDVIGDWRATMRNTELAWEADIPAIPTYHVGEPEAALAAMVKVFPKIAIGGAVRYAKRQAWATQVFARAWPKPIHGLGFGGQPAVLGLPFHSVDASSWESGPTAFGNWRSYGKLSVRGGNQNLRGEVEWYLDLERKARTKWKREMAALDEQLAADGWPGVTA